MFSALVSFRRGGDGPRHQAEFSPATAPEELLPLHERFADTDVPIPDWWRKPRAIELRHVDDPPYPPPVQPCDNSRHLVWMRTPEKLPDDPLLHACALAYASDMTLLEPVFLLYGVDRHAEDLQLASLDHAMWFHEDLRADEWLLYDQDCPVAAGGCLEAATSSTVPAATSRPSRRKDCCASSGERTSFRAREGCQAGIVLGVVADPAGSAAEVTHALARARLADVPALTERLMAAIFTDNPEWTDYSPVPKEDLWEGCRQYLERILQILSGEVPGPDGDDVAAAIGRRRAEQGVPLEVMLRTFRLGGRIAWEALVDQAHQDGADPDSMLSVATSVWTVIDGLSSTLSTSYRNTELDRLRRDDQRRHALVEDLLAGRARDTAFAQRTAKELDLPTGGLYLVIVAEMSNDGSFALRGHQDTLTALHFRSVWQVRADSLVGLVALEQGKKDLALDALRPLARGRVAVSPSVRGLAEVGLAHQLALTTLGTSPYGAAELVTLEERFPEALLVQSSDLAQRLLESQLGPILELPVKERDMLLETLTAWLEENCSTANAAVRLHCHRNTVLNRLHRITSLIGQSLYGRTAYVSLSLALSALRLRDGLRD